MGAGRRSYIGCLPGGRYLASDGGWSECRRGLERVNWWNALARYHVGLGRNGVPKSQDKGRLGPWTWSKRKGL
jgi:hypothetical protein